MVKPRIKFSVADYMSTPEGSRYQLLDGEMVLAAAPSTKHQDIVGFLYATILHFLTGRSIGRVFISPTDVVLSDHDVAQPDILFVSNERASIITLANIQGSPDLVVEVLSPSTEEYDRGYKRALYARHGVLEYWLVDPDAETVETLALTDEGFSHVATYRRDGNLTSPLLPGLAIELDQVIRV